MTGDRPKFTTPRENIITQISSFQRLLKNGHSLKNCTLQALDFSNLQLNWENFAIDNTLFLGCQMSLEDEMALRRKGAFVYHAPDNLPYNPFRTNLYGWQELMLQKDQKTKDLIIYEHFSSKRYNPTINEALWQRIHDHAIDDALRQLLDFDEHGMTQRQCVAFMGGHSVSRTDPYYRKTVETAKLLGEHGYFIASGGGPGIMEAANLGAYLAGLPQKAIDEALTLLSAAPYYSDPAYHKASLAVLEKFPQGQENLAIPTWFYGHEPSNLFASHIAKYFSNSIREDTLLAVALYGIVFAPGSAGTTQEIFMDAAQNHYATFNYYSPMVFLGRYRYEVETMIYPLLRQLAHGKAYQELLYLTDEPAEVLAFLQEHGPMDKEA
ncbi:MAG: hypothetical protein AAFP77_00230 [Bacteroidota bacterium]